MSVVQFIVQSLCSQIMGQMPLNFCPFFFFLGVNVTDHDLTFRGLSDVLQDNITPYVALLEAKDCPGKYCNSIGTSFEEGSNQLGILAFVSKCKSNGQRGLENFPKICSNLCKQSSNAYCIFRGIQFYLKH